MAQSDFSQKIAKQFELISTSFHEAGHVIISLLFKIKVSYVYVYYNKTSNRVEGYCGYEIPDSSEIQDLHLCKNLAEKEIGVKYAGLTAEKYHFKILSGSDKFPMFLRDGSSDDTISAANLIRQYNIAPAGKKRYQYKKNKINEILELLQNYWDDVTLVAHAIFAKKKLSFKHLKNLLNKKSKNKSFWKTQFKDIEHIFTKLDSLDEKDLKYIILSP